MTDELIVIAVVVLFVLAMIYMYGIGFKIGSGDDE